MKKTCFVIMGFGKKMDYRNSKEVDLDIIYKNVIQELFETELKQYDLVRADEVSGSAIIDVSMYTLLIKADLVIADISTLNENAIYELGVRHAVKPFSTIIMMQNSEKTKIPFDLNHCRILTYEDYGEKLGVDEAKVIKEKLKEYVNASENQETDSPVYTFLPNIKPPQWDEKECQKILESIRKKEDSIAMYRQRAEAFKQESEFVRAAAEWRELLELCPGNDYVIQQLALAEYKSKKPNETLALQNALQTIDKLNPENSLDIETLGITGAIYKRLYQINDNYDYLEKAIEMYHKGFTINNDYYNGENYANCLLFKTQKTGLAEDELIYLKFQSKMVYKRIIENLQEVKMNEEVDCWVYATLSTSYKVLGDEENYQKCRELFMENVKADWEIDTYQDNLEKINKLL